MDSKTFRALVVRYKDEGMTYQEISDKLEKEYNIKRSRQALQGTYTRAIRSLEMGETKERLIAQADIVNIFSLGYNMTEVTDIVNSLGYKLSYNEVVTTIKESKEYIEQVKQSLANRVEEHLDNCRFICDLNKYIEYKGITPTDKQLKMLVAEAYKVRISKQFLSTINSINSFTDDKIVEKKIISDLSLDVLKRTAKELVKS